MSGIKGQRWKKKKAVLKNQVSTSISDEDFATLISICKMQGEDGLPLSIAVFTRRALKKDFEIYKKSQEV